MSNSDKTTEVAAHMSFDTIRYSQVWEDSLRLKAALSIEPNDLVFSISSAGCNALSLLLEGPRKVISVDLNAAQNALVAFKMAAINHLKHQEFVELLGYAPSNQRAALYERIKTSIPQAYADFWQQNSALINAGVVSEGRLDRFIRNFAQEHFAKLPGWNELRLAFTEHHPELIAQFTKAIATPSFQKAFEYAYGEAMASSGRDPAQYRYVTTTAIGAEFYRRFTEFLQEDRLFDNPYLYFFLFGETIPFAHGPDYVRPAHYEVLRALLPRLELQTATIEAAVASLDQAQITKANLSNIFEYMSPENMTSLLQTMAEKFAPGSRVAYWNLLVDRPLPEALSGLYRVLPVPPLTDRLFFYQAFYVLERI